MKTTEIRSRLHHFIDRAEDRKVKAIYTILEEELQESEDYSPEFKAELDRRYDEHKKDGKVISREDMDKRIQNI